MATQAQPSAFYTNPGSTGTWTDVGASTLRFNSVSFAAQKSNGVDNVGNVQIRPNTTSNNAARTLLPGEIWNIDAPAGSYFTANQFQINIATAGDGVYVVYSAAIVYDGP